VVCAEVVSSATVATGIDDAGGSVGQGSDWRNGQAMANAVHGVEVPWRKLCLSWADDGDVPRCRFLPWSVNRSVLFLWAACLPWMKIWTFWLGNGGVSGVVFLL
jgi:hypothetical protein